MITVRKLKLSIDHDDDFIKASQYKFIRDEIYNQYRGLNLGMGILVANYQMQTIKSGEEERLAKVLEDKKNKLNAMQEKLDKAQEQLLKKQASLEKLELSTKKEESKLQKAKTAVSDAEEKTQDLLNQLAFLENDCMQAENNLLASADYRSDLAEKFEDAYAKELYQILKAIPFQYADNKSLVSQKIKQDFNSDLKNGLAKGERSSRNYKRNTFLMTRGEWLKFNVIKNEFYINWLNQICFKVITGRKDKDYNELMTTLYHIAEGNYKVCQSSLGFDKNNKLILNLVIDIPITVGYKPIAGRVLGIDLGIAIPAYVSLNDMAYIKKGFGCAEDFIKVRNQMKARREHLQKQLILVKGGRGRTDKLKRLDALKDKERNFAHTYNHNLSRMIIDFAIKNQCEAIHLEKLNKNGFDNKILGSWTYYELQQMIEYKAKQKNIIVNYVNPAYTSQTCSKCGAIDKASRIDQAHFECTSCNTKFNADYNASRNIALSKDFK